MIIKQATFTLDLNSMAPQDPQAHCLKKVTETEAKLLMKLKFVNC